MKRVFLAIHTNIFKMPISRQRESSENTIQMNTVFYYLLWYYMIMNGVITISTVYVLDDEGSLAKLLHGLLFFKFLFVFLSTVFFASLISKKIFNTFGPGTTYLCGLYFAIFTALVYYKVIVTAWNTESIDDIRPNFFNMLMDIGSELSKIIKSPLGYMNTIHVFIALLIAPTPIFGTVAVWYSFRHYSRLTEPVKETPVWAGRKYERGKFKNY